MAQRRPWLEAGEALLRLRLVLPDELFEAPLVTFTVGARDVAVAVEAAGLELDDDEALGPAS